MTEITRDFDEIWLHPTPKGMAFSIGGNEEVASVNLRVIIEANTRDDWHIDEVHMITFVTEFYKSGAETQARSREYVHVLEGDFLQQAKEYLYAALSDTLQDAVNIEILGDGETVGGNPGSTHVDAGARI
jgi:hypothetical protein